MVDDSVCVLDKWCAILSAQRMANPAHPQALAFSGGTKAGVEQLQYYLEGSHKIASYKETRNQLDGWDFSSKLSPWLAFGCISARQVAEAIRQYENQYQANDSTYWLYFELLWREYFQWLAFRYGKKMFALRGIQNKNPLLSFYSAEFTAWCYGNTASDFVNAFMRQLLHTGWMSNRGRQIVASYLINEMGVDWRYGAAWFEQQLIDYDVASNWGNWQYLAGVGTDPRGRRHFNVEKQRQTYDPESIFIERWGKEIQST
jgi:deoxyribodipyrimidine photo-lyase